MPAISRLSPTVSPFANGVLSGIKWASPALTYSFPTLKSHYQNGNSETATFAPVTAQMAAATRTILAGYASVSGLTFTEATSNPGAATIRLGFSKSAGQTAYAYLPNDAATGSGGDVWISGPGGAYDNPRLGSYAWMTLLHELGHAVGLKHGQEVMGAFAALPAAYDAMEYSVMTYRSYLGGPLSGYTNESFGFAQSLMMADIAGLQAMYGANFTTNAGNTIYSFNPATGQESINGVAQGLPGANRVFLTVWDGGGLDTYDFSNYTTAEVIDLNPGAYSVLATAELARLGPSQFAHGNVYNALLYNNDPRSLIENANGGSGNDSLTGNQAANLLHGGAGADVLRGMAGSDTLYGDAGADTLVGGAGADTLFGGAGADVFVFQLTTDSGAGAANRDVIGDYEAKEIINLSAIDANLVAAGDQAFSFIGSSAFARSAAGQVRWVMSGADMLIQAENTGDGIADFELLLIGFSTPVTAASFLL